MRALLLSVLVLGGACGDDDDTSCMPMTPRDPVEMEIIQRQGTAAVPVNDDDTVDLIFPPQAGRVIIAGAHLKNAPTNVNVKGWLTDPDAPSEIIGLVINPVTYADAPAADGWTYPRQQAEISDYANISACPKQGLPQDVNDQVWTLHIEILDSCGMETLASKTVNVTPVCSEAGMIDQCVWECDQGYDGSICMPPDAGP